MSIFKRYQDDINQQKIQSDDAQRRALQALDEIYNGLIESKEPVKTVLLANLFKKAEPIRAVPGLYMWGGVGRGKTYLMDLFYDSLPIKKKQRIHFHRFMQGVQEQLNQMRDLQNPLDLIAQSTVKDIRVLCLDEFQVTDIADAMILAGLLDGMLKRGITLIATSNTEPEQLYKDGLQRDRFLPAIKLIQQHTKTLNVNGDNDYRLRTLNKAQTWLCPADEQANRQLAVYFTQLSTAGYKTQPLIIYQRPINVVERSEGIAWFEFNDLCDGPRGQADYIELARLFHTVIISTIPIMDKDQDDKARRFIELIDEFYDRHVNLIASAMSKPTQLYQGSRLSAMFERTCSRLIEMQSDEYMALEHRP